MAFILLVKFPLTPVTPSGILTRGKDNQHETLTNFVSTTSSLLEEAKEYAKNYMDHKGWKPVENAERRWIMEEPLYRFGYVDVPDSENPSPLYRSH